MPKLRRDELAGQLVRAALLRHIERARKDLRRGRFASDDAIHGARKALKRARAALRLLRPGLGRAVYRRENTVLRRAARPLGVVRDSKVLIDRCAQISRRAQCIAPFELRSALQSERRRTRHEVLLRAGVVVGQRTAFRELAQPVERLPIQRLDASGIVAAIKRTYLRGRRALERSRSAHSVPELHKLRKQAQYLWHQLQLLDSHLPRSVGDRARKAHRVADLLGEDHDLALLESKIQPRTAATGSARPYDAFLRTLDRRRKKLEKKAFRIAGRLYEDAPHAFARRIVQR